MEREAERARWWHTAQLRQDMRLVAGAREIPGLAELNLIEAMGRASGENEVEGDITALKGLL